MNITESLEALRRANPRARAGFAESVEAAADRVHTRIVTGAVRSGRSRPRRRLLRASTAVVSLAAAAAVAGAVLLGSPGVGPGVANAAAAVRQAATVTAAAAERSGTAVVRITHNGEAWAGTTIRWNGQDMALSGDPREGRAKAGSEMRVVDGTMYGIDPERGDWVELGSPQSIDPDSGTTPDEYLAAVREDVGGATLHRITDAMTGLTTRQLGDGSTVYSGAVAAGLIARETGFKEGQHIRVFPFGYVAHDEAADPAAPLQAAVTVGADGVVREITVTWGTEASAWRYTVAYSHLGATPAPVAPEGARSLLRERLRGAREQAGTSPDGSK
jgi:hypothetical protein